MINSLYFKRAYEEKKKSIRVILIMGVITQNPESLDTVNCVKYNQKKNKCQEGNLA